MPPTTPTPAAPQKATRKEPPPKPVMPPLDPELYAELGDVVNWFPGADAGQTPMIGVVTGEGVGTLDLNVVTSNLHNTAPQQGVMHMDHPHARTDRNQGGGWRHRRQHVAVLKLLIAAGILVWDGDRRYVVSQKADLSGLASVFAPVSVPPSTAVPPKPPTA